MADPRRVEHTAGPRSLRSGLRSLRHWRAPRLLLVFFLIPVVLFSNPQTASAAYASGILTFELDSGGLEVNAGLGTATCQVGYAQNAGGVVISNTSRCDTSEPDLTPGYCGTFEAGCGSYGFVLKDFAGGTCGSTPLSTVAGPGDGLIRVTTILTGGYAQVDVSSCVPVEACLSYYYDPGFGHGTDSVSCVPIELDVPDVPIACPQGMAEAPATQLDWMPYEPPAGWKSEQLTVTGKVTSQAEQTGYWSVYGVVRRTDAGAFYPDYGKYITTYLPGDQQYNTQATGLVLETDPVAAGTFATIRAIGGGGGRGSELEAFRNKIIGIGVFWTGAENTDGVQFADVATGRLGVTDPARCTWYWGERIAKSDPAYPGAEDPIGDIPDPDIGDPPVVDEPPLPPTPDDEPSFWGAILAVLRSIWKAISGLASAIVNGIKTAIRSLFVPSESLSLRASRIAEDYQDKFPFNIGETSLSGLGLASPGGGGVDGAPPAPAPASAAPAAGGGCPDWEVVVNPQSGGNGRSTFDAVCDSNFTSAVVGARPFLLAGMIAVAFWPLVRGLFYASVPIIKPSPSSTEGGK